MKDDRTIKGQRAVGKAWKLIHQVIEDVGFHDDDIDHPMKLLGLIDWITGEERESQYFHIFSQVTPQEGNVVVVWRHYVVSKSLRLLKIQSTEAEFNQEAVHLSLSDFS